MSWRRWWVSHHQIFPVEASAPGISPFSSLVMARAPVYLKASVSIQSWASFWRTIGSLVATSPFVLVRWASPTRASSAIRSLT